MVYLSKTLKEGKALTRDTWKGSKEWMAFEAIEASVLGFHGMAMCFWFVHLSFSLLRVDSANLQRANSIQQRR